MPESTIICLDTSSWMRNGDYRPSRVEAMRDAARTLVGRKLRANPENTVGLITFGGKTVNVLAAPTTDSVKLLRDLHGLEPTGESHFLPATKIAALALKHRKNRAGDERIMLFVGSPVGAKQKALNQQAVALRRTNIAVDVIMMGENEENEASLTAFVNKVNNPELMNSHLVSVPVGQIPYDVIEQSPILGGGGTGGSGASGFMGAAEDEDPEIAMALRASLETARQTAEATGAAIGDAAPAGAGGADEDDEDAVMQAALAMSLGEMAGSGEGGDDKGEAAADNDAAPAAAAPAATDAAAPSEGGDAAAAAGDGAGDVGISDPAFLSSVLAGLEGVDMSDPEVAAMLAQAGQAAGEGDGKEGEGDGKEGEGDSSKK